MSHSVEGIMKQKEDGRVDFIASLVANDSGLSDESIMAVAIVSANFLPIAALLFPSVSFSPKNELADPLISCSAQVVFMSRKYNWLSFEENSKSRLKGT